MNRKWIIALLAACYLCIPVQAMDLEAPQAPDSVAQLVPEEADSFAEGMWNILQACISEFSPALTQASKLCLKTMGTVLFCALVSEFAAQDIQWAIQLAGVAVVGATLLEPSAAMMELGVETIRSLSEYGKLLIPVMTGALAAQGGGGTAAALYGIAVFFNGLLSSWICGLMAPLLYLFLALSIGFCAVQEEILGKLRDFLKWMMQWVLKFSLYLFTGFLTVTGVVSGSADAAVLKAAKITISGAVPVIGGILSDASEAVLVGAGVMRSSMGVYGLLTVLALFLSPFMKMGAQYLMIKLTDGICSSLHWKGPGELIHDFCTAMGLVLAATATQTVLLLIGTVCLMKGVS